ncbi:aquaporin [[Mycobacterium] kokjensenii]|uniref:Aquaporin n=1 Tax=[Mycobacterium] kokjensenii TaxID=3064287 RepID=A0ABM9LHC3_9MYCO|nr:aquaporin [Mycolicibacter sp. MU0083]CAJ1499014.1 aquaporin [Mycolicibacter sp. MU0083]
MADQNAAVRKYLTEMIGTFVFMFAVLGIVKSGTECVAAIALGIGSVLMVMVYASGHISGGHLNPAVSIAAYLRGALPAGDLGPYIVAQLVGALAAFGVGIGLWHDSAKYPTTALDLSGNVWPAFLAELVFTFALCYVVLHTATSKDSAGNSFYGLAIGFVVTVGVVAVGGISGGAFNPAITFGLMLSGNFAWKFLWVYLLAQVIGAAVAAYAYKATSLDEHTAAARRG